jgi:methionyl-tRNA formyltransferase
MLRSVRVVAFCDESAMPDLIRECARHDLMCVVAHNRLTAQTMASDLNVPSLVQGRKGSHEEHKAFNEITQFKPDVIISWSYGLRIPKLILDLPRCGAYNVHGGLLPEWRGANVLNWVLIEGAHETGVTIHQMTENFDEGPIVIRHAIPISFTDTALTLRQKLHHLSVQLVSDVLANLERGNELPSMPQDERKAKYYKRRSPEDGLIDWSKSNLAIYNLIRGLVEPWPGAFTFASSGEKVIFKELIPFEAMDKLREQFSEG